MAEQQLPFSELVQVRQSFPRPVVTSIQAAVTEQLQQLQLHRRISPGDSVALTAGSRGIANIAAILQTIAAFLKTLGTQPFIVPAMGSHGGATPQGQVKLLERLGITESACGCPIRSNLETDLVRVGAAGWAIPINRQVRQADHLVLCNRIKPHTSISGELQSGLVKMSLVGLGSAAGAQWFHQRLVDHSLDELAAHVAEPLARQLNVIAGVGIVENAYQETALIEAFAGEDMVAGEKRLLQRAVELMPGLPFQEIDVLLIDQIGKDISGTGMDTNVVGRKYNDHCAVDGETPRVKRICVRALSPATEGNATGIGLAEFCHARVLQQLDRPKTHLNCLAANHPTAAMLPMDFPSDRDMLRAAAATIGPPAGGDVGLVWIKNTLTLSELVCSANLAHVAGLTITRQLGPPSFDEKGELGFW